MSVTGEGVVAEKNGHRLRSNALGLIETIGSRWRPLSSAVVPPGIF